MLPLWHCVLCLTFPLHVAPCRLLLFYRHVQCLPTRFWDRLLLKTKYILWRFHKFRYIELPIHNFSLCHLVLPHLYNFLDVLALLRSRISGHQSVLVFTHTFDPLLDQVISLQSEAIRDVIWSHALYRYFSSFIPHRR